MSRFNMMKPFQVELTAPVAGVYNANVQFASKPVPKSPFKINVQASADVSQVFVKDLPECKMKISNILAF